MNAIDLSAPVTPAMIPQLQAAGIRAVIRYLSNTPAKNLTAAEARLLSDAGIDIVLVWEAGGDRYSNFTAAQGLTDAQRACTQANMLRVPAGAVIYFAVDFDASATQIAVGISNYFRAVKGWLGRTLGRVGVYGNGAVCQAMLDAGLADRAWLWGGGATNGSQAFYASGRWSIHQHPTVRQFGASIDPDDVQGDYGGWRLPPAAGQPPIAPASRPPLDMALDRFAEDVKSLQGLLASAGYYHDRIDGDWGPKSRQAALDYRRAHPAA